MASRFEKIAPRLSIITGQSSESYRYVRRIANTTLRTYAHNLLHFVRWWESAHHTGDIVEGRVFAEVILRARSSPKG